jgi:hypothetical protein
MDNTWRAVGEFADTLSVGLANELGARFRHQ